MLQRNANVNCYENRKASLCTMCAEKSDNLYNRRSSWSDMLFLLILYKWLRAIVFLLCAYAWLFLVSNFTSLLFNELFPPFYSSILKPDFHLSFRQSQLLGKIEPLPSDHILLACELSFQALQLLHGKNGAHAFRLFDGPICFVAAGEQSSCNDGKGPSEMI